MSDSDNECEIKKFEKPKRTKRTKKYKDSVDDEDNEIIEKFRERIKNHIEKELADAENKFSEIESKNYVNKKRSNISKRKDIKGKSPKKDDSENYDADSEINDSKVNASPVRRDDSNHRQYTREELLKIYGM
jgi:hypothetical protein